MNDFDTSPLALAVSEIVDNSTAKANELWSLEFKLLEDAPIDLEDPDLAIDEKEKQGFFAPLFLGNIDFISDFEKSFCDHVNAEATVGAGMWLKVLYPARNHMRAYLKRFKATRQGGAEELDDALVLTFKPIFKQTEEAHDSVSETIGLSRTELDARHIVSLSIDLMDPSSEAVQSAPCGGNWRDVTAMDVLRYVYSNVCSQFTFEGEPLILYQRVSDGFNTQKRAFVQIQAGTLLTDLPLLLHQNHGGLWSTGAARYIKGDTWYFYPPYDTTRVNKEKHTLTIVRAPDRLYAGTPKTWLQDGDHIKIIASGDINIKDGTQEKFLQTGDGVRYGSSDAVLGGSWLELKGNKAIANRAKNMSEVRIEAPAYTDNRIVNSKQGFTDNTMFQLSALAGKKGNMVALTWNYADHTLIKPGMPCRILYERNKELTELNGVVVGMHAAVQTTQRASSEGTYLTTCALFIFCQLPDDPQ